MSDTAFDQHLNMILGDVEEVITTTEIDDETYEEIVKGFDIEGLVIPRGTLGISPGHYEHCGESNKIFVKLYAKMGLHRYNMLLGGNFELLDIKKFNMKNYCPSTFYLTLDAIDATTGIQKVFQVTVFEDKVRYFHVRCTIARPKVPSEKSPFLEIGKPSVYSFYKDSLVDDFYKGSLPEWPLSEDDFNDTRRFYVVKKSELQNHSWIHLYLELALATKYRNIKKENSSLLEIVKVMIETKEVVEDRLNAKWAILYIRYKNLTKPETWKSKDCLAIVRRVFNETTGDLMLEGDTATWERGFHIDEQSPLKRSKTDECQSVIEEDHELEEVDIRRRSTRTPKPIKRFPFL